MITLVAVVRYEVVNFAATLHIARHFVDRAIVVIDENAEPGFKNLCPGFVEYYERPLNWNFSEQRNFASEKVKEGWILVMDSDEYLTPPLWFKLRALANSPPPTDLILFPRNNILINSDGTVIEYQKWPDWQPHFHRAGIKWRGKIHSWPIVGPNATKILGPREDLCIIHPKTEAGQQRRKKFYASFPGSNTFD